MIVSHTITGTQLSTDGKQKRTFIELTDSNPSAPITMRQPITDPNTDIQDLLDNNVNGYRDYLYTNVDESNKASEIEKQIALLRAGNEFVYKDFSLGQIVYWPNQEDFDREMLIRIMEVSHTQNEKEIIAYASGDFWQKHQQKIGNPANTRWSRLGFTAPEQYNEIATAINLATGSRAWVDSFYRYIRPEGL